jgi:predicted outer membrane repeat protein
MGGGLHNDGTGSHPSLSNCLFLDNQAKNGGGMYDRNGAQPTLVDCEFTMNSTLATGRGGGIYAREGSLDLMRCLFDTNSAHVDGGAVYNSYYSTATLDSCVFQANTTDSGGGAIYFYDHDTSTVKNCTFYQNESPNGGALWTWLNCYTTVQRCIFRGNTATNGSQIGINSACTMTVSCSDVQYGQPGVYVGGGSTLTWGSGNIDQDPLFCNVAERNFTIDAASPCAPAHSGGCGLIGAKPVGCTVTGVEETTPNVLALYQNHPNPFNPTTTISFILPERTMATLAIYDVGGRLVRMLVDEARDNGLNQATWDGKDAHGNPVSSGVYFYRLTAGSQNLTRKMTLLK